MVTIAFPPKQTLALPIGNTEEGIGFNKILPTIPLVVLQPKRVLFTRMVLLPMDRLVVEMVKGKMVFPAVVEVKRLPLAYIKYWSPKTAPDKEIVTKELPPQIVLLVKAVPASEKELMARLTVLIWKGKHPATEAKTHMG